jgi:putative heme-binding domain-containing protein
VERRRITAGSNKTFFCGKKTTCVRFSLTAINVEVLDAAAPISEASKFPPLHRHIMKKFLGLCFATLIFSQTGMLSQTVSAPQELPAVDEKLLPFWIWPTHSGTPKAEFEREFVLAAPPVSATLRVSCDNGCKVFVNGALAATNPDWASPVSAEIRQHLVAGKNKVWVQATNEGSTAGFVCLLDVSLPDGSSRRLISDHKWTASTGELRGGREKSVPAVELRSYGAAPWFNVFQLANVPGVSKVTTGEPSARRFPAGNLKLLPGFRAELLHEVPDAEGSWVAMCVDPKGRIIASSTKGGLTRITPPPVGSAESPKLERMPVEMGHANGMVWAFNSLYVMVCQEGVYGTGSGVYKVTDSDGDDLLDSAQLLRKIHGQGDHGPHALLVSPDGKSITVVCGNSTRMTEIQKYQAPPVWRDDLALPKLTGHGFMLGVGGPAGYIARMSPDGQEWTLVSTGLRNQYDAAYNRDGELFTYDADMEWDLNLPWYRPTRICHLVDGAEFGWRSVSGKWPEDYADSLPPVVNVGRGSPTGVTFGYGARFPGRYQNALYVADWTYGKLYAAHLKENGATYSAELEVFAEGSPLPLTDLAVNPEDGALYFGIGSRGGGSALYRVYYAGEESTTEYFPSPDPEAKKLRALRHELEDHYHGTDEASLSLALQNLAHPDRFIRFAARTLLEFRDSGQWAERALLRRAPQDVVQTALALARLDQVPHRANLYKALGALNWGSLDAVSRLDVIRALQVVAARLGDPEGAEREILFAKLHALIPASETRVNVEAAQLLARWKSPLLVAKVFPLFENAETAVDQISYAVSLRFAEVGWEPQAREKFFRWFLRPDFNRAGNLGKFIVDLRKDALLTLGAAEKAALRNILAVIPGAYPAADASAVSRKYVKNWSTKDLVSQVEPLMEKPRNLERGRALFRETACVTCHAFQGEGGAVGPDLTLLGGRFRLHEIIESLTEPSKVISDQYGMSAITLNTGTVYVGRIVNEGPDLVQIQENVFGPSDVRDFARKEIQKLEPSPVSLMPPGLVNTCSAEEVADLVAWLISGIKK